MVLCQIDIENDDKDGLLLQIKKNFKNPEELSPQQLKDIAKILKVFPKIQRLEEQKESELSKLKAKLEAELREKEIHLEYQLKAELREKEIHLDYQLKAELKEKEIQLEKFKIESENQLKSEFREKELQANHDLQIALKQLENQKKEILNVRKGSEKMIFEKNPEIEQPMEMNKNTEGVEEEKSVKMDKAEKIGKGSQEIQIFDSSQNKTNEQVNEKQLLIVKKTSEHVIETEEKVNNFIVLCMSCL